jgi:hypothetical protein
MPNEPNKIDLTKDATIRAVTAGAVVGLVGIVLARTPRLTVDKLPKMGDFIPFKVDAINAIYWGPFLMAIVALVALYFATKARLEPRSIDETDMLVGRILIGLFAVVCLILVAQTFLITGPADLCPDRPNLRLLWTWRPGFVRMAHCMSETEAMNATAPYYSLWVAGDAWCQVGICCLTWYLSWRTWRSWSTGTPPANPSDASG